MSLRRTLTIAATAITVAALAALWLTDRWVVRTRLLELEDEYGRDRFRLVEHALARETHALAVLQKDWAFWDDTYEYVQRRDAGYVERNLTVQTFIDAGLSAMYFYDTQGLPVWQGSYDREGNPREDFSDFPPDGPPRRVELIQGNGSTTDQRAGLMRTDAGPALVASSAVLSTASDGPSRGALVMVRLLDAHLLAALRESTATNFEVSPHAATLRAVRVHRVDEATLRVQGALTDVFGAPSLSLSMDLPRSSYQRHRTATLSFAWVMGAIVLASFGLLLWAVRRVVVKPILTLAGHADRMRRSGDFSLRAGPMRADEIGTLASQLDTLMTEVERRSEELRQLALIDPLTGALNRRAFDMQLDHAWKRHANLGTPLAMLMCDVDHFKHYNNRYGHPAGDACLKSLVDCLLRSVRTGTDGLFRLGGDEFAILVPDAGPEAVRALAEKICDSVAELRIAHSGVAVARYVTICVGAASVVPSPSSSGKVLVERADQALFQAKHGGRNRAQTTLEAMRPDHANQSQEG